MVNFFHIFVVMPSGWEIATEHTKFSHRQCEIQSANTIRIRMKAAIMKQFAQSRGYADPNALMMAIPTQENLPTCGRDIYFFIFRTPSF